MLIVEHQIFSPLPRWPQEWVIWFLISDLFFLAIETHSVRDLYLPLINSCIFHWYRSNPMCEFLQDPRSVLQKSWVGVFSSQGRSFLLPLLESTAHTTNSTFIFKGVWVVPVPLPVLESQEKSTWSERIRPSFLCFLSPPPCLSFQQWQPTVSWNIAQAIPSSDVYGWLCSASAVK